MTQVEVFMMMYSLLLGLAMTSLLAGVGELLRGRKPPRWGILVPLSCTVIFVILLGAFVDSYSYATSKTIDMSLRSMGLPALAGVLYFLAATLSVPREHDGWDDLDAYFMGRKHLIFGCLLAAAGILIIGVEVPNAFARGISVHDLVLYSVGNIIILLLIAVPILTSRRIALIASMIALLLMLGLVYFTNQSIPMTLLTLWRMVTGG